MNLKTLKDILLVTGPDSKNVRSHDCTNYLFAGFRFLGVNMPNNYRIAYIIYSGIINGLVTIFLPMAFTISYIISSSEMEIGNLLTSLQVAINVYGCAVKIVIMGFLLKKLRNAEAVMDKLDARCIEEDEKDEIRKVVRSGNRMVVLFSLAYFSYSTSTFLSSVIMGRPPYSLYIPFVNWKQSTKDFIIAAATEYILIDIACFQQVVDDSYAVIYVNVLRTHVQILLLRISKLGSDSSKTKEENTKELIRCILDHKNIIELYDIIHPVISTTIFIQFLITAAILGTTLINILIFADMSSIIASLFYIVAVVVETLPCCYYANCLMDESDQFGNTIFHSNWMEQDHTFRKMLVFFIQRSQRTITLTAGKLFPITLNSFLGVGISNWKIAKFSFSLYTLLSEMDYGKFNEEK